MSRKNLIRLALLLVLLLVLALIFLSLLSKKSAPESQVNNSVNNGQPVLMTLDEKTELGIPNNLSVEILNRNKDGQITTYKLIKDN